MLEPAGSPHRRHLRARPAATPANAISFIRLLVTVPFLLLDRRDARVLRATLMWVALCITDGIDGWVARKQGTTRSGAFLDPLADKVMVLGAMWALVASDRFAVVPVTVITVRELGLQAFRSYWGRLGLSVPASWWAKVKTVVQEVAVGLALVPTSSSTSSGSPTPCCGRRSC